MNDRYLYRAKHIHVLPCNEHLDGTWVIGYLSGEHYISNEDGDHLIDPETICQCTGLKDKNGKLIWENDIVKHFYIKEEPDRYDIGVVQWDDVHLRFKRTSKTDEKCVGISFYSVYEVIGSTFDNPELLE